MEQVHWNFEDGYFLSGMYSIYDDSDQDRQFKWKYARQSVESSGFVDISVMDSFTSFDATWTVSCSSYNNGDSALMGTVSIFSSGYHDRIWQGRCGNLDTSKYSLDNCAYTGYLSSLQDTINFNCPDNGVVRSIWSQHDNSKQDRLFKFECCHVVEA